MKNFLSPLKRQAYAVFAFTVAVTLALCGTGANGQIAQVGQPASTTAEMGLAKALGTTDDAGEAIRAYMAEGIINKRPNGRVDYTDYYVVNKPAQFLGHELQMIEQEYMTTYVGCCVSPGTGLTVRLNGSSENLRQFSMQNRCSFEDNVNFQEVMRGLKLTSRPGNYASISCRERDRELAAAAKAVPPPVGTKQLGNGIKCDSADPRWCPGNQGPPPSKASVPAQPVAAQSPRLEPARQVYINAGATICVDMYGMNKAKAIRMAGNSYSQLPDSCVVMKRSTPTRILRESTPIPGVVIIEAGQTAAMADRNDLTTK